MVNGTRLYFRGYPILKAIVADLKTKGMSSASDVILTGSSGEYYIDYIATHHTN